MIWNLTLSSQTTRCASITFLTCLPSSGQSTIVILRDSYLSKLDRTNRQRCARFLTDVVTVTAFPLHTESFALQLLDLTLAAAVYILIKFGSASLQQPQALLALSDLLAAIAELLARYQPHNATTFPLSALAVWVKIFGLRLSPWEEQQLSLPQHPDLPAAPPTVMIECAHLIAATRRKLNLLSQSRRAESCSVNVSSPSINAPDLYLSNSVFSSTSWSIGFASSRDFPFA